MYQVSIQNTEKKIKKGEYLSFTIAGFPPNTKLDYNIGEQNNYNSIGLGSVTSGADGGGKFATQLDSKPGKYRLTVRNYTYGAAHDEFTIVD
jgi:hypothetical protein